MSDYPKYQATYMHGPINLCVRTDESPEKAVEDLETMLEKARQSKALNGKEPVQKTVSSTTGDVTDQWPDRVDCPDHQGQTLYKKDGKYGVYYSHKWGEGWCNKKPKDIIH